MNSSCSCSRVSGSTAPNGSSMSSTGGSAPRARATPTRWASPPDSSCGYLFRYIWGSRRTSLRSRLTRSVRSERFHPSSRGTRSTFSSTVRCGIKSHRLDGVAHIPTQVGLTHGLDRGIAIIDVPRRGLDQRVDTPQCGRFAAPARTDEHGDPVGRNMQCHIVQCHSFPIPHRYMLRLQERRGFFEGRSDRMCRHSASFWS